MISLNSNNMDISNVNDEQEINDSSDYTTPMICNISGVNLPSVLVHILKNQTLALVDTGAQVSAISSSFLNRIKFPHSGDKRVVARSPDGTPMFGYNDCEIQIQVGDQELCHNFKIVDKLKKNVILGFDLIKKLGSTIDTTTNLLLFGNQMLPLLYNINATPSIGINPNLPCYQRPTRYSEPLRAEIDKIVNDLLSKGIIEPSQSEWASPVVLTKKPNGQFRFCINYKKLNSATRKKHYPLPNIEDLLHTISKFKYISILDPKLLSSHIKANGNSNLCHLD